MHIFIYLYIEGLWFALEPGMFDRIVVFFELGSFNNICQNSILWNNDKNANQHINGTTNDDNHNDTNYDH